MALPHQFLPLIISQQLGRQQLARVQEPSALTDADENVAQYDQVMSTKLVLAYAAALCIAHRARPAGEAGRAVDIACGPGHYSLCLSSFLGYESVLGVDLSPPMIEVATANATKLGKQGQVRFQVGDATDLHDVDSSSVELSSFADAAHHLPDLATVSAVLQEMDRITKPEGLVMVMDLARLRTERLTEKYVNLLGKDYIDRGLGNFFEDFRNSMYAAWTVEELRAAIPTATDRVWCHIVPRGLPTTQIILGLPEGRRQTFVRSGVPWQPGECPVPSEMRSEWHLLRTTLALAAQTTIAPAE